MKPGDRIGVVGPNGAGKTTLVRTLLGELAPDEGEVVVGINTRFSYLDQTRAALRDDKTVLEEVVGRQRPRLSRRRRRCTCAPSCA